MPSPNFTAPTLSRWLILLVVMMLTVSIVWSEYQSFWVANQTISHAAQRSLDRERTIIRERLSRRFAWLAFFGTAIIPKTITHRPPTRPVLHQIHQFLKFHPRIYSLNVLNPIGNHIIWSSATQNHRPIVRGDRFIALADHPHEWLGPDTFAKRFDTRIIPMRYAVTHNGHRLFFIGSPYQLSTLLRFPGHITPYTVELINTQDHHTIATIQDHRLSYPVHRLPVSRFLGTQNYAVATFHTLPWALEAQWSPRVVFHNWLHTGRLRRIIEGLALLLAILGGTILQRRIGQQSITQQKLERVSDLYATLADINHMLPTLDEPDDIYRTVCRIAVDRGGMILAFVSRPDTDGWVQLIACAGQVHALDGLRQDPHSDRLWISIDPDQPEGQGTVGQAFRHQEPIFWQKLPDKVPNARQWQPFWETLQAGAMAALPIWEGSQLVAILSVYHHESGIFDAELQTLLKELATNIGQGLTRLTLQQRAQQALAALQRERQQLDRMAHRDPLTELPNRLVLEAHLPQAIARTDRSDTLLFVGILDIDDFKAVNDTYGHDAGDQILKSIADRLQNCVRNSDLIVRMGGDEFILVLEGLRSWQELDEMLARIESTINEPADIGTEAPIAVKSSLGFVLYPLDDAPADTLLRHADMALYQSKESKSRRTRWSYLYDSAWEAHVPELGSREMYRAHLIQTEEVEVAYQPIVDVQRGQVVEVEALARLKSGSNLLLPRTFLAHLSPQEAYRLSLIVCDQALAQWRLWAAQGLDLRIAVNFTPQAFFQADFIDEIQAQLQRHNMPPNRLCLEILEDSDFLSLPHAHSCLTVLRKTGVSVVLDDFGRAYASLLRLKSLPIDGIKLDQEFVRTLMERPQELAFVAAVQQLAAGLHIPLVVEGAETTEVVEALRFLGVTHIQGFAFSPPVPADHIPTLIDNGLALPPLAIASGHWFAAYAAHYQWMATRLNLLMHEPDHFRFEKLEGAVGCPVHHIMSSDPQACALHEEEHRLMVDMVRRCAPPTDPVFAKLKETTNALHMRMETLISETVVRAH